MNDNYILAVKEQLKQWYTDIKNLQIAHQATSSALTKWHYWLGVPVIILTSFVGTSVFATLQTQVDISIKIFVGLVSVFSAILASINTFLRFSERAEKHRSIANQLGSVRREIEQIQALNTIESVDFQKLFDQLRIKIDSILQDSPEVPISIIHKLMKQIKDFPPQPRLLYAPVLPPSQF